MFATMLIRPDSTEEVVDRTFDLKELQTMVGGYIETVPCLDAAHLLIVDEEGLLSNLPLNRKATELVRPDVLHEGIRGNALDRHPSQCFRRGSVKKPHV